jgi:flagellar protein FliS
MAPSANALRQYGATGRGEIAEKGAQISWAYSIIAGLRESLDGAQGGEIAANLDRLYDYMGRRLIEANRTNAPELLDEVSELLRPLKTAWDALPEDARSAAPAA